MQLRSSLFFALSCAAGFAAADALAQGSLTPPGGPPLPVMKTLDQVEARIPLVSGASGVTVNGTSGAITIAQRGSYYLTGNLTISTVGVTGITINSDDVTIDLNGYSLICTGVNGGSAIDFGGAARRGITIRNGTIVGGTVYSGSSFSLAGWNDGINGNSPGSSNRVSDLVVRGVRDDGIELTNSSYALVERCLVDTVGGDGIVAGSIIGCTVRTAGGNGILATGGSNSSSVVRESFGESVGSSNGVSAIGSAVSNSRGYSVGGTGLRASVAENCMGISLNSTGLTADLASNCFGRSFGGGIGLDVTSNATNCYGTSVSGTGLTAASASFCQGSRSGGAAIAANIAIGCTALSGTVASPSKHLGTP